MGHAGIVSSTVGSSEGLIWVFAVVLSRFFGFTSNLEGFGVRFEFWDDWLGLVQSRTVLGCSRDLVSGLSNGPTDYGACYAPFWGAYREY